jgi:L-arabinokinase
MMCRSPSFNIQVNELMDGEVPKPYSEIKAMLAADIARKWAAYVAGCVVVLMRERGLRLTESLAILIDSEVPEGEYLHTIYASQIADDQL